MLRETGRLDEALVHFRRAVELDPADALARTNLGQMLLERGQAEEALPHVRGSGQADAGRCCRCTTTWQTCCASCAVTTKLARPTSRRFGSILVWRKRTRIWVSCSNARAGSTKPRCVSNGPSSSTRPTPILPRFLGDVYVARQDFGEAINCYKRAIAIAPEEKAGLHVSLGWALQEDGRLGEAVRAVSRGAADRAGPGHGLHSPGRLP